ncbi:MAG: hypothetical protein VX589_18255 [Myxococcota bacterium]|nr:hypothetical protein [Myxococcota bacterium]
MKKNTVQRHHTPRRGQKWLMILGVTLALVNAGCSDEITPSMAGTARDASPVLTPGDAPDGGLTTGSPVNDALVDTAAPDLALLTSTMTDARLEPPEINQTTEPTNETPTGSLNGETSPAPDHQDADTTTGTSDNRDSTIMPVDVSPPQPTLGLPNECDLNEGLRYENFVLANNCPGPCCWEFPGDQLRDDPKRNDWIEPRIHSAYHDLPTRSLKSDVPAPVGDLKYYVPFAKFGIDERIEPKQVACVFDRDCRSIGPALTATCARQDGDNDGQTYADNGSTEYLACLTGVDCVDSDGIGGDLATQSAVPSDAVAELCTTSAPPGEAECLETLSSCVYAPAWVSPPPPQDPRDYRAPAIVRSAGRLFIQGVNFIDTDMEAYFVRVRSTDRNGPRTHFNRMMSDPLSGDVVLKLNNGGQCVMGADESGDCSARTENGHLNYAIQPNTLTRGAGAAHTPEAAGAIEPMFWYLERENQWLRYHQRLMDGVDVDYGYAELYDDLVIAEVPSQLAPGLYAVQLGYRANQWLQSIEDTYGRQSACLSRRRLQTRCLDAFENPSIATRQCEALSIDCNDETASVLFERDRRFLTNPIYVQIAPNQIEQTYRISVDTIRAIQSGEYGPGAYGPRDRADIWVSDDVNLFSMIVRFDPERMDDHTQCMMNDESERPMNPACDVSGPWFTYLEDIEPEIDHSLLAAGFSAEVTVRPGEVINVVTFAFDTDGRSGNATGDILRASGDILGGVAQIVAGAYGAPGIGQGIAGAVGGIFGLTDTIVGGLKDPELIGLTVTSYTAEELAFLTLAAQMGLTPQQLLETNIGPLNDKPLFETRFQGFDYDITETIELPAELSWARHHETRRLETRAPDAKEIGCIREHLLNSCAYRGHSTYEFDYTIEHVR